MKIVAPLVAAFTLVLLTAVLSASPSTDYWECNCVGGNYTIPSKTLKNCLSRYPMRCPPPPTSLTQRLSVSTPKYIPWHGERCLAQAFQDARVVCPFRKNVSIYYELCVLAFAEEDILSHFRINHTGIHIALKVDGPQVPAQRFKVFKKAVRKLFDSLAIEAAYAPKMFATGQKDLNEDGHKYMLYGLADCSLKMSAHNCKKCLENLLVIPSFGHEGEWRSTLWCSYRFEPKPFFHIGKGNNTNWILAVVAGVLGAVIIITVLLILILWCRLPAKRPSAIKFFDEITARAQDKEVLLFLDYDGTLTPIVKKPDEAFMSEEMRGAVREAASAFPTSVVTGRAHDKVKEFIQLNELHYAGSHGTDIQLSDETEPFQPTSEYLPTITEATERLDEVVREIKGATIENNKFFVSVHYRNVHKKEHKLVKDLVNRTLMDFSDLKVTHGKMVLEVRPKADFNKGHAVNYLLEYLGNKNNWDSSQVLAIYIGDDTTDEDAFKVLCGQDSGFGILVSKKRRKTEAFYSLKNPHQVKEFLQKLVSWHNGEARV